MKTFERSCGETMQDSATAGDEDEDEVQLVKKGNQITLLLK